MTNLERLIEVLTTQGYDQLILDTLILDYYTNQYSTTFETDDKTFYVLDEDGKADYLYNVAEEIYYDTLQEIDDNLNRFTTRSRLGLKCLLYDLPESSIISNIVENLDFATEYDKDLLADLGHYSIYAE